MQIKYRGSQLSRLFVNTWNGERDPRAGDQPAARLVSTVSLAPKSRAGLLFVRYAVPRRLVSRTTASKFTFKTQF